MSRLFAANMVRLWKSRLLGIGLFISAGLALVLCLDHYYYRGRDIVLDGIFFGYVYLSVIPVSVLAGLFLGAEYGDGTIRNKLIVGHKRGTVYLAGVLSVFAAAILMSVAYIAVICAVGMPLWGWLRSDWEIIVVMLLESILVICALAALFTMIGMLWQNKALSGILCILLAFGMEFLTITVDARLREPKVFGDVYTSEVTPEGEMEIISLKGRTNPGYVEGTKRVIYEFLYDFNPVSQAFQIANMFEEHPGHMVRLPLYSLIIIFAVTGEGMYLFGKKDLK